MSKLAMKAADCTALSERMTGQPNWQHAEIPDLVLLLAELRRQYIAANRKK